MVAYKSIYVSIHYSKFRNTYTLPWEGNHIPLFHKNYDIIYFPIRQESAILVEIRVDNVNEVAVRAQDNAKNGSCSAGSVLGEKVAKGQKEVLWQPQEASKLEGCVLSRVLKWTRFVQFFLYTAAPRIISTLIYASWQKWKKSILTVSRCPWKFVLLFNNLILNSDPFQNYIMCGTIKIITWLARWKCLCPFSCIIFVSNVVFKEFTKW